MRITALDVKVVKCTDCGVHCLLPQQLVASFPVFLVQLCMSNSFNYRIANLQRGNDLWLILCLHRLLALRRRTHRRHHPFPTKVWAAGLNAGKPKGHAPPSAARAALAVEKITARPYSNAALAHWVVAGVTAVCARCPRHLHLHRCHPTRHPQHARKYAVMVAVQHATIC